MQFFIDGEYCANDRWTLGSVAAPARGVWKRCSRLFTLEDGWRSLSASYIHPRDTYPDMSFFQSALVFSASRYVAVKGTNRNEMLYVSISSRRTKSVHVLLSCVAYSPKVGERAAEQLCDAVGGTWTTRRYSATFLPISALPLYMSEYLITADPEAAADDVEST